MYDLQGSASGLVGQYHESIDSRSLPNSGLPMAPVTVDLTAGVKPGMPGFLAEPGTPAATMETRTRQMSLNMLAKEG